MSRIEYAWQSTTPPKPDVYTTRRGESKYLTLRYWDGARWFSLDWGPRRGGTPFTWPKPSRSKRPSWATRYGQNVFLKNINEGQAIIQWGEPFKVFDEKEVLAYLVRTGVLPQDWKTAYQAGMRAALATA
jgi:hypothetical protein